MTAKSLRWGGFIGAVALICLAGFLTYRSVRELVDLWGWVEHTQVVQAEMRNLQAALFDAEMAERGFALTRDEDFLDPYHAAVRFIPKTLDTLSGLTHDNSEQQQALLKIKPLLEHWLVHSEGTIAVYRRNGDSQGVERFQVSKSLLNQMRPLVASMISEEMALLDPRKAAVTTEAKKTLGFFIGSTVLSLIVLTWIFFLAQKEADRRRKTERRIQELNAQLESRVRERTSQLATTANLLETVISSSPYALITLDRDGEISSWNKRAEDVFGYPADVAVGQQYMLHPDDEVDQKEKFIQAVAAGNHIQSASMVKQRRDGTKVDVLLSMAPLRYRDGKLFGAVVVLEDVTARRIVDRQLYQAQKMEAVGQLTGGLAHDFNNLLAVVIGNLDLIIEGSQKPTDEIREGIEAALVAALRGAELTRQLLAFSRQQPLKSQTIFVPSIIKSITNLLKRTLGENIVIETRITDNVWPVNADPAQLESALVNLAINARHAMPQGGRLIIEVRNQTLDEDYVSFNLGATVGRYVMISVTDTGIGMSPEVLERAFEPFFTTKGSGEGTGLGLSMIYGFVKQTGGHIKLYSEEGVGTTVRLYLPYAATMEDAVEDPGQNTVSKAGHGETVLVVEDNEDVRRVVVKQLTELGYSIKTAENATEALTILDQDIHTIDLLFTDIIMPGGVSGVELARIARERRPDIKVLFTSGFPDMSRHADGITDKDVLLTKPYRRQELAVAIQTVLEVAE